MVTIMKNKTKHVARKRAFSLVNKTNRSSLNHIERNNPNSRSNGVYMGKFRSISTYYICYRIIENSKNRLTIYGVDFISSFGSCFNHTQMIMIIDSF